MEKFLEEIFLSEIEFHCKIAIKSYEDLQQTLTTKPSSEFGLRIWTSIQSILISCANISKILNPQTPRDKTLEKEVNDRGEYLRQKLSVTNNSPILSTTLRNHLEHFDERLHISAKESRIFILRNIGPSGSIQFRSNSDISPKSYMANFDQKEMRLTFWEDEFDIKSMIFEVKALLTATELSKLGSSRF
ncbi:MAG: hypothetical protein ACRD8W_05560 [Nitrososphaeraceae archaeon]